MPSRSCNPPDRLIQNLSNTDSYPQALADKSWDNTGRTSPPPPIPLQTHTNNPKVLLEAPHRADKPTPKTHTILLTIDITRAVVDEAISLRSDRKSVV